RAPRARAGARDSEATSAVSRAFRFLLAAGGLVLALSGGGPARAELLVPMDPVQTDHLRAYGLTYWALQQGFHGEWLLNYRGGSFLLPDNARVSSEAAENVAIARKLGYSKVSELKKAVARAIKSYVAAGGFLFAMCSATDTFDIALAAEGIDIVGSEYDGDPPDPHAQQNLDFGRCLAFQNFELEPSPLVYEYSNIDTSAKDML